MLISSAEYIKSSVDVAQCPKANYPEYAFWGRSNVGKSSLINLITNKKNLALVSRTPGKTRAINHFLINKSWYLVDLPGYGFAKESKKERANWESLTEGYLRKSEKLACVFLLIDSRLPPQEIDLYYANQLGAMHVPFIFIFTKADKQKAFDIQKRIENFNTAISAYWEPLPEIIISSSKSKQGKKELLDFIRNTNKTLSFERYY